MTDEVIHSKLGASSASRWMNCPGSVALCEKVENTSSEAAKLGTDAHTLAELCLKTDSDAAFHIGEVMPLGNEVDDEMADAVQVYLDEIRGYDLGIGDQIFIEHKFHLKDVHEDLFGTNDCAIYKGDQKKLYVFDYKHGSGVPVEVKNNRQLTYYGLGAVLDMRLPVDEIELVIVQPRCYHRDGPIRRWTINLLDLNDWSVDLLEAAKATEDPNAPINAGDWCRWCNAAAICPELERIAKETVLVEFTDVENYDKEKLAQTLKWVPILEAYAKSVREFAYQEAMRGEQIPNHKLVEKVGRRQPMLPEPEMKVQILQRFPWLKEPDITKNKLEGLGVIESIIKKHYPGRKKDEVEVRKSALEKFNELFEKKSSGFVLVPDDDGREAVTVQTASDEFDIVDDVFS